MTMALSSVLTGSHSRLAPEVSARASDASIASLLIFVMAPMCSPEEAPPLLPKRLSRSEPVTKPTRGRLAGGTGAAAASVREGKSASRTPSRAPIAAVTTVAVATAASATTSSRPSALPNSASTRSPSRRTVRNGSSGNSAKPCVSSRMTRLATAGVRRPEDSSTSIGWAVSEDAPSAAATCAVPVNHLWKSATVRTSSGTTTTQPLPSSPAHRPRTKSLILASADGGTSWPVAMAPMARLENGAGATPAMAT
mmetsp:Transcript_65639/g.182610  ORF Transcript_65639/g.182610 Transcript_65639/m.182610 type:complete len:253 (-) Transcript_65639:3-761(-)